MKIPFKPSNLSALAASAVVALTANSAHAALALVNFGSTAYTSDGANTWQTFNLSNGSNLFAPVAATGLSDTTGASSGITITITGVINGSFNGVSANVGASQAQFDTPASGTKPSWFDSLSAAQRETFKWFSYDITYTFSGFSASDTVQFDFVVGGGGMGTGDRAITLSRPAGPTILMNDLQTNDVGRYATLSGLTGSTSYSFLAKSTGGTSAALVNAIGMTVIPEPSTFALLGLGGLALLRRRRK